MTPYWLLFVLIASVAITHVQTQAALAHGRMELGGWWAIFFLLTAMIGLRHEVGGDWSSYLEYIDFAYGVPLADALTQSDPAYGLLNWLGARLGDVYLVNTVCAAIFTWGLLAFCRAQPFPWLALMVAVPYLIIVVAMGYTRQGVAIGLAMLGLVALGKGRVLHFVLWIAVAALFHKSAVILAPVAALAATQRRLWVMIWVGTVAALMYFLLLQESVENLRENYLEAQYQSSGAAIRIAMNALPAFLLVVFFRRFALPREMRVFWLWMAWGALALVPLLYVSPSSTAVDRVALYWIPLQLFVLSRLPTAFGSQGGNKTVWVILVLAYSASIQFVWLSYADTAFAWLPYRTILFE